MTIYRKSAPQPPQWSQVIERLIVPQAVTPLSARGDGLEGPVGRIFGGQAIAQAVMAGCQAERSGRLPHSLHASFLRAGDVRMSVDYQVTEHFLGRSFAQRQVIASQGAHPILVVQLGFHIAEPGPAHQTAMRCTFTPAQSTERLARWRATADERGKLFAERLDGRPIEIVPIDPDALFGADPQPPHSAWWMRLRHPLGAAPDLARALLAYASDMMLLRNAMLPHGIRPFSRGVQTASLDHAIWFHDTPDMDDWLLFETDSPWAGHARGLSRGHFFTASGHLIASVTQESLMRVLQPPDG
jgi:acyl-CoA thioesterase-2